MSTPSSKSESRPLVVIDESGQTGEQLLDPQQPVFALASIRADAADLEAAVAAALAQTQMPELKYGRLAKGSRGRATILGLLDALSLEELDAAVSVFDKGWMVAAKLVDDLVEPTMLTAGVQHHWYASGEARAMAEHLYRSGPDGIGPAYTRLAESLVAALRDFSPARAREVVASVSEARVQARDSEVLKILNWMVDSEEGVTNALCDRDDSLDPALSALSVLGGYWTKKLDRPFDVLHDESRSVARWTWIFESIARNAAQAEAAGEDPFEGLVVGDIEIVSPRHMASISFGRSDQDKRLQAADVLAGAAAHWFSVLVGGRVPDKFARDLDDLGIGAVVKHTIGPLA